MALFSDKKPNRQLLTFNLFFVSFSTCPSGISPYAASSLRKYSQMVKADDCEIVGVVCWNDVFSLVIVWSNIQCGERTTGSAVQNIIRHYFLKEKQFNNNFTALLRFKCCCDRENTWTNSGGAPLFPFILLSFICSEGTEVQVNFSKSLTIVFYFPFLFFK